MNRTAIGILAVIYLLAMGYFGLRPFRPIRGLQYAPGEIELAQGAVHVRTDAALEDRRNVALVRESLMGSNQISVDIVLQPDSFKPHGGIIFGLARESISADFMLGQDGNAVEFCLRTTRTDHGGRHSSLIVPMVFDLEHPQHLLLTYDGMATRLYVEGVLRAESHQMRGTFDNWGFDHALVIGDLPPGGNAWAGRIWRMALYDRALDATEAERLTRDEAVEGAVLAYRFDAPDRLPSGLRRLHYRNLFVATDETVYDLDDCILNTLGFVPMGMFVYLLLPPRVERRKVFAVIVLPLFVGGLASCSIEFLQRYIIGRVPCSPDLVYNLTGSLLGGLLGWLSYSTFENKTTDGRRT